MNAHSDTTLPRSRRTPRAPTWDRASQLLLEGILVVVMLLTVVLTVAQIINIFTGRQVAVPVALEEHTTESVAGASVETSAGVLTLTDTSTQQLLVLAAPTVLGAAVVLCATFCLFQVVRSLRRGVPFHRANVRRLTVAAVTVLGGGMLVGVLGTVSTMALAMDGQELLGDSSAVIASGELPLWPLGLGLLLACLAEFFRRGTAMTEDLEGLV